MGVRWAFAECLLNVSLKKLERKLKVFCAVHGRAGRVAGGISTADHMPTEPMATRGRVTGGLIKSPPLVFVRILGTNESPGAHGVRRPTQKSAAICWKVPSWASVQTVPTMEHPPTSAKQCSRTRAACFRSFQKLSCFIFAAFCFVGRLGLLCRDVIA